MAGRLLIPYPSFRTSRRPVASSPTRCICGSKQPARPGTKGGVRPTHLVSFILLPLFGRIDENETRSQAKTAVTLAAADLLKATAQTSTFPASLPAQFTDPFTNKPLGYRLEGAGFVVYSAGPGGTFDGGKPGDKRDNRQSVFRYPLVPRSAASAGQ